jgi:hypothetical protein
MPAVRAWPGSVMENPNVMAVVTHHGGHVMFPLVRAFRRPAHAFRNTHPPPQGGWPSHESLAELVATDFFAAVIAEHTADMQARYASAPSPGLPALLPPAQRTPRSPYLPDNALAVPASPHSPAASPSRGPAAITATLPPPPPRFSATSFEALTE